MSTETSTLSNDTANDYILILYSRESNGNTWNDGEPMYHTCTQVYNNLTFEEVTRMLSAHYNDADEPNHALFKGHKVTPTLEQTATIQAATEVVRKARAESHRLYMEKRAEEEARKAKEKDLNQFRALKDKLGL